jgi:hypothetical protein
MFRYFPPKARNLPLVIVAAIFAWQLLSQIEDDLTYLLTGDDRSMFLDFSAYGLWRYLFRIAVVIGCGIAVRKNFSNGDDTIL